MQVLAFLSLFSAKNLQVLGALPCLGCVSMQFFHLAFRLFTYMYNFLEPHFYFLGITFLSRYNYMLTNFQQIIQTD